jgi:hypothetical protein
MEPHEELVEPLKKLLRRVMAVVDQSVEVLEQLDRLVEAGFEGPEAVRLKEMIDELNRLEHEADIVQDDLARKLFGIEEKISPGSLFIWNKILNKIGDIANTAEKMGNRLRLFIAQG